MEFTLLRPRLPAVTSLRYLAALHVAIFHIREMGALPGPGWFQGLASIGYVGVSFFFVLSGFILVYTYAGRQIEKREFYWARFARIYPAYAFSLLITFPFFYFGARVMHVPFFAFAERHFVAASVLVLGLVQSWVPSAALSWNAVAWSLSVEAFFYALFPYLLVRYSRLSRRTLWLIIPACWLAGLATSLGYMALRTAGAGPVSTQDFSRAVNFVKFWPIVRLPEFLMGMATGWLFLRRTKNRNALLPVLAGLTGVALVVAFVHRLPYLVIHTAILGPAFAAIVYGVALEPKWAAWLNFGPLVLFGDASYSFYLLHSMTVWPFFHRGMQPDALRNQTWTGVLLWTAMMTGISIGVYKLIEEPARRRLRRKRSAPSTLKQAATDAA